jgi:hypothetical protein
MDLPIDRDLLRELIPDAELERVARAAPGAPSLDQLFSDESAAIRDLFRLLLLSRATGYASPDFVEMIEEIRAAVDAASARIANRPAEADSVADPDTGLIPRPSPNDPESRRSGPRKSQK